MDNPIRSDTPYFQIGFEIEIIAHPRPAMVSFSVATREVYPINPYIQLKQALKDKSLQVLIDAGDVRMCSQHPGRFNSWYIVRDPSLELPYPRYPEGPRK